MKFILRLCINAALIFLVAYLVPGLNISGVVAAFFFALVLGVVNAVIRPLLSLLSLPLTILTLGFFALIINAFTFWLASVVSIGVSVESFFAAFIGGILVWVASVFTGEIFKDREDKEDDK